MSIINIGKNNNITIVILLKIEYKKNYDYINTVVRGKLMKILLIFLIILLSSIYNTSWSDDISVIDLINKQLDIIEEQDKKIRKLDNLVKELSEKIDSISENNKSIPQNISKKQGEKKDKKEIELADKVNESEISSPVSQKIYNPEKAFFGPLQPLKSKDGNYTAGIMGLVQLDAATHNQEGNKNTGNDLSDGFIVRRAVLTLAGLSEKDFIWFLSYNYANGGDYPKSGLGAAAVIYRGYKPWWIFAGLFGNSVGLDASNFSTQRQFLEPAMPQATFAYGPGSPAIGVAATYRGNDYYVRVGFYGEPYKNESTDDEGMGIHGRVIWQPIKERKKAFHLGITGYWRTVNSSDTFTNNLRDSTLQFRTKGENVVGGDYILDTGIITDLEKYYHGGIEFAVIEGPLSFQSEWGIVNLDRKTQLDPSFSGGYVQGGYMLTNDSRNYNAYFAQFWRVKPNISLTEGGMGAWEIAIRASTLNLTDAGIAGGKANSYTLGVNWYMTSFVRSIFNLTHTDAEGPVSEDFNVLGARLQLEF